MGDWDDIPWPLRLRIQTANFVFYLLGAIPRVCLVGFGIFSVAEIKSHYYTLRGIGHLAICVALIWLDLSMASGDAQEDVRGPKRFLLKTAEILFYPIGVLIHSMSFVLIVGGALLVRDHHLGAIILVAMGLILISVGSQEVAEPKEWLRADHFLVR